jgi:hypothetical protein
VVEPLERLERTDPRVERSEAVERLERLELTDPHPELSKAMEPLERLERLDRLLRGPEVWLFRIYLCDLWRTMVRPIKRETTTAI